MLYLRKPRIIQQKGSGRHMGVYVWKDMIGITSGYTGFTA